MIKKLRKVFQKQNINVIPEHESPVRSIVSKAHGTSYKPIKNFEDAKRYNDSYMIMEGDFGGQIYLSIPVKLIKCDYEILKNLLKYLDKIAWECNKGEGSGIYFERKKSGEGITGGMGGGVALNSLWIHNKFSKIKNKILDVLSGKKKSIKK